MTSKSMGEMSDGGAGASPPNSRFRLISPESLEVAIIESVIDVGVDGYAIARVLHPELLKALPPRTDRRGRIITARRLLTEFAAALDASLNEPPVPDNAR